MIVIAESDSTTLPDRSRTIGIRNMIEKINSRLKRKKKQRISSRTLAQELDISRTSVRQVLRSDLEFRTYKQRTVPLMTDTEKSKRKKFAN